MSRRAVVFGASGQLAIELVRELAARGYSVTGLSRAEVDVCDGAAVEAALARSLKATAVDELGNVYEGRIAIDTNELKLATGKRFARWVIDSLDPGVYMVKVQSKLFRTASKQVKLGPERPRHQLGVRPRRLGPLAEVGGMENTADFRHVPPPAARVGLDGR